MACGAAAGRAAGQTASSRASVRCWHPQSISKAFILPLRSRYRPNAAETLGPMVDHVEDVTRLNLAQSFELNGVAPGDHPDVASVVLSNAAVSTAPSDVTLHASGATNGHAATYSGSLRRLSTGSTTQAQAAPSDAPGVSAAAAAAAAALALNDASGDDAAELQSEFAESRCAQDVLDIVADELPRFAPRHTITALQRLARLTRGMPRQERATLLAAPEFGALLERLYLQASRLNAFQLSASVYSAAVLGVQMCGPSAPRQRAAQKGGSAPPPTPTPTPSVGSTTPLLLPALEAALGAKLSEFNDRDAASALYGYALLRATSPGSLRAAAGLCSRAQSLLDRGEMGPQAAANALWAAATLDAAAAAGARRGGGGSGVNDAATAFHTAARALASSGARAVARGSLSLDGLGPQGVANSAWAAAKLGVHDKALLSAACTWLSEHAAQCKPQELLNVLWAAAAGRHRPAALASIARHAACRAEALAPADVASLLHILGVFGFDLSGQPEVEAPLLARGAALLPRLSAAEAASAYWGLGMCRSVKCELYEGLTQRLADLVSTSMPQPAAAAAATAARDSGGHNSSSSKGSSALPDSLLRQAFQGYLAGRLEGAQVTLPAPVLEHMRAAWLAGGGRSSSGAGTTALLRELGWLLNALRVRARVGVRSRLDGLLRVDVELTGSGGRPVALQLLGEREVDDAGGRLGPVAWEDEVLKVNGYQQVHWLRVTELKRVPHARRPRYLADVLRRLGVGVQERLLTAAEASWAERAGGAGSGGRGAGAGGCRRGGGGPLDLVGSGGITASEADVLMRDRHSSSSSTASGGGWASGGRGSRSQRGTGRQRR